MMMQQDSLDPSAIPAATAIVGNDGDYAAIIRGYTGAYLVNENFIIVGNVPQQCRWYLSISSTLEQFPDLLRNVLPVLQEANVGFRIPKDDMTAKKILNGDFGFPVLSKLLMVFPSSDEVARAMERSLKEARGQLAAPEIPMAARLSEGIYVEPRTPSDFKPSDWPFAAPLPKPGNIQRTLRGRYRITGLLKEGIKGDVYRGKYIRKIVLVRDCVIKQGRKFMFTDNWTRTMSDRMDWQYRLQRSLQEIVPLPSAIDYFIEDDDAYLVMEYIAGRTISQHVAAEYAGGTWFGLDKAKRKREIENLLAVINIVETMHNKGYVHRDVTPHNFMIDRKGKVVAIDLELAYSVPLRFPTPPFGEGTTGYMSPEQTLLKEPTPKEDIFALGGFLVFIFAGKAPRDIAKEKRGIPTRSELSAHIAEERILDLVAECYSHDPQSRPSLQKIRSTVLTCLQDNLLNK